MAKAGPTPTKKAHLGRQTPCEVGASRRSRNRKCSITSSISYGPGDAPQPAEDPEAVKNCRAGTTRQEGTRRGEVYGHLPTHEALMPTCRRPQTEQLLSELRASFQPPPKELKSPVEDAPEAQIPRQNMAYKA